MSLNRKLFLHFFLLSRFFVNLDNDSECKSICVCVCSHSISVCICINLCVFVHSDGIYVCCVCSLSPDSVYYCYDFYIYYYYFTFNSIFFKYLKDVFSCGFSMSLLNILTFLLSFLKNHSKYFLFSLKINIHSFHVSHSLFTCIGFHVHECAWICVYWNLLLFFIHGGHCWILYVIKNSFLLSLLLAHTYTYTCTRLLHARKHTRKKISYT